MEVLNKLETAATLAAVRAVISSAPYDLSKDNALKTAEQKLDNNLEKFNQEKIDASTR